MIIQEKSHLVAGDNNCVINHVAVPQAGGVAQRMGPV